MQIWGDATAAELIGVAEGEDDETGDSRMLATEFTQSWHKLPSKMKLTTSRS